MVLKNVYRGDVIQCHGFSNGEILSYKLPSGNVSHRYGRFDRVVARKVVLVNVGEDMYIDLNELSSHFGNASGVSILSTKATGEDSYYVDRDTLVEYEYSYIPEDNYEAYGETETYDESVRLSKK
ncbi:MAG: hypothetical protein ACI31V_04650 [Bacilli bacterium]